MKKVNFESLDPSIQELLKKAEKVRNHSYSPYSQFKVGASVLTEDNEIFAGCNVENATFTSICAERTAYVKAISEGKTKFKAVAVVGFQENFVVAPCGTCRQFMSEFGNVEIYMAKPNLVEIKVSTLDVLLPCQFHFH
uniref:Cytidine deaminase n=1 Tax=Photinus pyralis TaxID=7054 RepID=A0A1Y1K3B1_PHOPY